MMLMTAHRSVMGDFTLPPVLRIGGWLATAVMALAAVAKLVT
jgi:Mn2+/Fe2+ NRAMP family transporter